MQSMEVSQLRQALLDAQDEWQKAHDGWAAALGRVQELESVQKLA